MSQWRKRACTLSPSAPARRVHSASAASAWRVATEREVEFGGATRPGAGYLHPACAAEFLEKEEDVMAALRKNSRGLSDADLAELEPQVAG